MFCFGYKLFGVRVLVGRLDGYVMLIYVRICMRRLDT